MSFKIAIASGKGGTGKTTVSVNLSNLLNRNRYNTLLADCDVEEPNSALFFSEKQEMEPKECFQKIPEIDSEKCTFCGKCAEYCEFNAISIIKNLKYQKVHSDLCHSCGACSVVCKHGAIKEIDHPIGSIQHYRIKDDLNVVEGRLKIGSAMQTMLINQVKEFIDNKAEILVFDAPPGTSCPMVETVADADFVVLVTEPTPFGLYDLKLAVDVVKQLGVPFGVFVNKAGLGTDKMYEYLKAEEIMLLGEVPFDRNYASKYAEGKLLDTKESSMDSYYEYLVDEIKRRLN
ncbi:cobyrinic acid a,c-diamide synthase [Prolixibacteraceae bacterium JC049]|nr:cobyrinic acid a,c-diamide synthase [Prolixibacteraceae bacterium JC049]